MAIDALIPLTFVLTAIDWEVQIIMIKSGGFPGILAMTLDAICRELRGLMIRIICVVVFSKMTTYACVWRIIIIAIVT
jgi:hypothetical protein